MPEIDLDAVPRPALTAAVRAALALADELDERARAADAQHKGVRAAAYEHAANDLRSTVTAALAAGGGE